MGLLLFMGNCLFALGPVASLLIQNVFEHPARVVVCMIGVFMYFLSLVLTGTLWQIASSLSLPVQYISIFAIISVFFQEMFRFYTFKFMKFAQPGFEMLNDQERKSVQSITGSSISIGCGFALAASVYTSINSLVFSLQPGVPGINRMDGDEPVAHNSQLFFIRSVEAGALGLLNFFWTLIMFHSLDRPNENGRWLSRNGWLFLILGTHLVNTLLSLLNHNENSSLCLLSLTCAWLMVLLLGTLTGYKFGGSKSSIKAAMNRTQPEIVPIQ